MTYSNIEVMSNFTTSWVSLQEKLKEIIQAERYQEHLKLLKRIKPQQS